MIGKALGEFKTVVAASLTMPGGDWYKILVKWGDEWIVATYKEGDLEWHGGRYFDHYTSAMNYFKQVI